MSVAEKLKISSLLLLLTAWADGTVGPQPAPWALGEEELLDEGLGRGRPGGPFNRALILPASFEAPKSDPQVHLFQEALLGTQYCHMCVCVCVCF